MIILDYNKKNHKEIIAACVHALKQGKTVAYPTDTSYGLACDATNKRAIGKVYKIKERDRHKPVHVITPSRSYALRVARWSAAAKKLVKKFWPGPLTVVLPLTSTDPGLVLLSAKTKSIGLRMPNHSIALDLAKSLGKPITTTSANPSAHLSNGYDSYSANDIIVQFEKMRHKPDILINAGKLPKRKPSTMVKIVGDTYEILREGPITKKQIEKVLKT